VDDPAGLSEINQGNLMESLRAVVPIPSGIDVQSAVDAETYQTSSIGQTMPTKH